MPEDLSCFSPTICFYWGFCWVIGEDKVAIYPLSAHSFYSYTNRLRYRGRIVNLSDKPVITTFLRVRGEGTVM